MPHVRYETKPGQQLQVDWKENLRMTTIHSEVIYKSQDNLTNLLQLSVLNFFRIKFIFDSIRWTINIK